MKTFDYEQPVDVISDDLRSRILAMAERWDYAPDELAEALALAQEHPEDWQRLVEHDEEMTNE